MQDIIVLASGDKTGGGSGFENLHRHFNGAGNAYARIAGVVSNIPDGGVKERADRLKVPFLHLPASLQTAEGYQSIGPFFGVSEPWFALSGWLRFVVGLPPARTINIHPALLSQFGGRFGGPRKFGHHVHELVAGALERGELGESPVSGFTMHFVVDGGGDKEKAYDRGPVFAEVQVSIRRGMDADEIRTLVNQAEHAYQPRLTEMVVRGLVRLSPHGRVLVPAGYQFLPR